MSREVEHIFVEQIRAAECAESSTAIEPQVHAVMRRVRALHSEGSWIERMAAEFGLVGNFATAAALAALLMVMIGYREGADVWLAAENRSAQEALIGEDDLLSVFSDSGDIL